MADVDSSSNNLCAQFYHREKLFNVVLTDTTFSWCPIVSYSRNININKKSANTKHTILLAEVLAAFVCADECPIQPIRIRNSIPYNSSHRASFRIHIVEKLAKNHKWKERKLVFDCRDSTVCQKWVQKINNIINEFDRPRRLLVFINPIGGKKQGPRIYATKVQPFFELVNIKTEVIVTERANHAKEFLEENKLEKFDGVISVGGDGMFHEVLNGAIARAQCEQGVPTATTDNEPFPPTVKLGIIPAGSTDTIAYCTTGNNDPVTSALHIVLGYTLPLDVCSVTNRNQLITYSMAMQAYGFLGDVMKDSEKLRWLGPSRYDFSGTKKFFVNRGYEGTVMFREVDETDSGPRDHIRCRTGCFVCSRDKQHKHDSVGSPRTGHGWKTLSGRFTSIIGANISCMCAKSPEGISPSAHLADGCLDLVLVRHTSRLQHLRHMIRITKRASDQFDFGFVEVYRVKEYRFRPLPHIDHREETSRDGSTRSNSTSGSRVSLRSSASPTHFRPSARSIWNVDGQLVEQAEIHVKSHRQLIQCYAGGVEDCEETPSCSMMCRRKR